MISDEREGNKDVEAEAEHRADYRCAEATGSRPDGGGVGARETGVSKHTIYAWKSQFGGMEVNEAEELRSLRDENQRLKKLVADLSLDKEMLKSLIAKNVWSAAGLQAKSLMKKVCVNVSGLFGGQKALATMSMRAHPSS